MVRLPLQCFDSTAKLGMVIITHIIHHNPCKEGHFAILKMPKFVYKKRLGRGESSYIASQTGPDLSDPQECCVRMMIDFKQCLNRTQNTILVNCGCSSHFCGWKNKSPTTSTSSTGPRKEDEPVVQRDGRKHHGLTSRKSWTVVVLVRFLQNRKIVFFQSWNHGKLLCEPFGVAVKKGHPNEKFGDFMRGSLGFFFSFVSWSKDLPLRCCFNHHHPPQKNDS